MITMLPVGSDVRRAETADLAAQLYVVWPRFPAFLHSRIIGYVWDRTAPAGTITRSQKTGRVTFIDLWSGSGELGHWLTERRNVNDTHSVAESFMGPIRFRAP